MDDIPIQVDHFSERFIDRFRLFIRAKKTIYGNQLFVLNIFFWYFNFRSPYIFRESYAQCNNA